jgi:beta-glucanase (GH16 family)
VAFVVVAALVGWQPAAEAQPPPGPPTWSDEFDGTSLDLTHWSYRATGPRNDGNLTPDAVSVGGGLLTITTYTEAGQHYSGMISSHTHGADGFEPTYGYFEARVKFNDAPGQWSAFWLQSRTIGSPIGDPATAGVEMDIAEHRTRCVTAPAPTPPATCAAGNDISDRVQQALIWDGYGADLKAHVKLSDPLPGLGNGGWHTWALRWAPAGLTFYYDGAPTWSMSGPISRRSQYMILSSEVGRFFAGDIPAAGYGSRDTSTTKMQVDYVRVWAVPNPPVNTAAPAASGTPEVGQALACSAGSWSGYPAPAYGYEWLRDGAPIEGAASPTYTVQATDAGHALSCRVTATNSEGSAAALSAAVVVPVPPPAREAPAPPPPPPPFVPFDNSAPNARLSGRTSQKVGPAVRVTLSCPDEACRATAAGAVRVPRLGRGSARTYASGTVTTAVPKGANASLRLTLSRGARAGITRALRAGRRVVMKVAADVADGAANRRSLTRRVSLRR